MAKSKTKSKEGQRSKNRTETEKDDDDDSDDQKSPTESLSEQQTSKFKGSCSSLGPARILVSIWFACSLIYNILSVGLIFYIQIKYGGQPPTSYYQWGAIVSIAVSFLSMTASILAIIIVDFCKLTVCPFECFSGTTIIIMVMTTWGVCSIGCCATAYAYGDAWMDPQAISDFTKTYYAQHGEAPPFLDTLQKRFGGLCCGGIGFEDYGDFNGNVSYIHLPASCCLPDKRSNKTGPDVFNNKVVESANTPAPRKGHTCGTFQWVPFYLALEEFLKWTIKLLDYGTQGDEKNFLKVLLKRAGPYMSDRYERYHPQMVRELSNRYKQERPVAYKKLKKNAQVLYPGDPTEQNNYIKNEIEKESVDFVESKKMHFEDTKAVKKYMVSVPYGCGEMVNFLIYSEWSGRKKGQFANFQIEHGFIFWGLLFMALSGICINLTNISLFTYGVAIPRPLRDYQDNDGGRKGSIGSGSENMEDEKGMTTAKENEDGSGDGNGDSKANKDKGENSSSTNAKGNQPGDTFETEKSEQ